MGIFTRASTPEHLRPFKPKPNGSLFVGLNALRALSIVALLLVIASNVAIKAARHPASTTSAASSSASSATTTTPDAPKLMVVTVTPTSTVEPKVVTLYGRQETASATSPPSKSACPRVYPDEDPEWEWVEVDDDDNSTAAEPQPTLPAQMIAATEPAPNVTVNDYCNYIPHSTVPLQTAGMFWSVLNRIFIILEAMLLILAEVGFPQRIFLEYLPMLGPAYGLGTLGVLQALIASSVLSHHSALFPQVSAWLLFMVSCGNVFFGIFLRQKAKAQRALFRWEAEEEDDFPPKEKPQLSYDWSEQYQARLREQAEAAEPQRKPSVGSLYSSTIHSHYSQNTEPRVVPGARFGGLAFGKQADLEREGRPQISRPIELRSGSRY